MNKRDMNVTAACARALLAAWCLPFSLGVLADTTQEPIPEGVDISGWICKYCVFEEGWSGEVEGGAGYVSDDSYKFGEYNGLQDKGAYPVAARLYKSARPSIRAAPIWRFMPGATPASSPVATWLSTTR